MEGLARIILEAASDVVSAHRRQLNRDAWPWEERLFGLAIRLLGLGGIAYEIFVDHSNRSGLYVLLGGMVGLPSFVGRDKRRQGDEDDEPAP